MCCGLSSPRPAELPHALHEEVSVETKAPSRHKSMKLPSGPAPERSRANTGGSIDSTSSLAPLLPPAAALATSPTAIEAPADSHSTTSPIVTREGIRLRKAIQFVLDRDLKGYQAGKFAGKGVGLLLVREKLHPEEIFEVRPKDGIFRCIICNNKLQKKVGKAKISDSADPLHSIDLDKDEPGNYDFIICGPACFFVLYSGKPFTEEQASAIRLSANRYRNTTFPPPPQTPINIPKRPARTRRAYSASDRPDHLPRPRVSRLATSFEEQYNEAMATSSISLPEKALHRDHRVHVKRSHTRSPTSTRSGRTHVESPAFVMRGFE